jgi:hypothetical protein
VEALLKADADPDAKDNHKVFFPFALWLLFHGVVISFLIHCVVRAPLFTMQPSKATPPVWLRFCAQAPIPPPSWFVLDCD